MITLFIGRVSATRVVTLIFGALQDPNGVTRGVEPWAVAVGGEQMNLVIDGVTAPGASMLAVGIPGGIRKQNGAGGTKRMKPCREIDFPDLRHYGGAQA
jgi:hypothetical protein